MSDESKKAPQAKEVAFNMKTAPSLQIKAVIYDEQIKVRVAQQNISILEQELAQRAQANIL